MVEHVNVSAVDGPWEVVVNQISVIVLSAKEQEGVDKQAANSAFIRHVKCKYSNSLSTNFM